MLLGSCVLLALLVVTLRWGLRIVLDDGCSCAACVLRCDLLSGLQLDCLPDKDMSCVRDYNAVVDAVTAKVKRVRGW